MVQPRGVAVESPLNRSVDRILFWLPGFNNHLNNSMRNSAPPERFIINMIRLAEKLFFHK
jgi:hypothetical protein